MSKRKKVLIADDDPSIAEVITIILRDEGYETEITTDGNSLEKIDNSLPDLILLDIWMSGVDGRDICKYLKTHEKTKGIPVIMISANKDTQEIAAQSGADDFIAKPFDIEFLVGKVKQYAGPPH